MELQEPLTQDNLPNQVSRIKAEFQLRSFASDAIGLNLERYFCNIIIHVSISTNDKSADQS